MELDKEALKAVALEKAKEQQSGESGLGGFFSGVADVVCGIGEVFGLIFDLVTGN